MNSLQVHITAGELQSLIDDPDLRLVTKRFEGKGIPEAVVLHIIPDESTDKSNSDPDSQPNTMNLFFSRFKYGEKQCDH